MSEQAAHESRRANRPSGVSGAAVDRRPTHVSRSVLPRVCVVSVPCCSCVTPVSELTADSVLTVSSHSPLPPTISEDTTFCQLSEFPAQRRSSLNSQCGFPVGVQDGILFVNQGRFNLCHPQCCTIYKMGNGQRRKYSMNFAFRSITHLSFYWESALSKKRVLRRSMFHRHVPCGTAYIQAFVVRNSIPISNAFACYARRESTSRLAFFTFECYLLKVC